MNRMKNLSRFRALHMEKSKILAKELFVLEMPGKYFCSLMVPNFADFTLSHILFHTFCCTLNFLTRAECKISTRRNILEYINLVQYLHTKGTFLCRNFYHTLKKFIKKNQILYLLGEDTETTYIELSTPYVRLKYTSISVGNSVAW